MLYKFTGGTDGANPYSSLTSDGAGNLFGTTYSGGVGNDGFGYGTVFELSRNGTGGWNQTVIYSFCSAPNCVDGSSPFYSNVIFDSVGNLYGTTALGGAYDHGVVFELRRVGTGWTETVLHSFPSYGPDGANPASGLIMDPAGNLYGTTVGGGAGRGTVFELSPSGGGWTEQVIHDVDAGVLGGGLTMDAAGNIFGIQGSSTVFELLPRRHGGWNKKAIYTFPGAPINAWDPVGTLALDQAGNLYGTTHQGGVKDYGSVYELSPGKKGKWTEKTLHSFPSGDVILAGVVLDAAGNIYGTTAFGGKYGPGTVFELVAQTGKGGYKKKILWSFNGRDGFEPVGSVILDNAGNLYGTTEGSGRRGAGDVYEVTP